MSVKNNLSKKINHVKLLPLLLPLMARLVTNTYRGHCC